MHLVQTTSHILHLLLSVITVGFWIPIWILVALIKSAPQCTECGGKRGLFGLTTTGANRVEQESREEEYRDEIECPYCAEIILARARVCKHCGRDID